MRLQRGRRRPVHRTWSIASVVGVAILAATCLLPASAAATVIEVASRLGIPVSTTHVISSAILGVGATKRRTAVQWTVAGRIVTAWVVTIPACIALGPGIYYAAHLLTGIH